MLQFNNVLSPLEQFQILILSSDVLLYCSYLLILSIFILYTFDLLLELFISLIASVFIFNSLFFDNISLQNYFFDTIFYLTFSLQRIFKYLYIISNSSFVIFFIFGLTVFFWKNISEKFITIVPKKVFIMLLQLFNFVYTIVKENILIKEKSTFYIWIFLTFFIIMLTNLLGMLPYSFTVTSHLIVTFFFSFFLFFGININGILKHGFGILGLFFPGGAPLGIAPFLILIEAISYLARLFSLAIRLFANMMSGHTLLKILTGFSYGMLLNFSILNGVLALLPLLVVFAVTFLEMAIAFLQAYVFSVLTCIYINDAINLH